MKRAYAVMASLLCFALVALAGMSVRAIEDTAVQNCSRNEPFCFHGQFDTTLDERGAVAMPKIATPAWLQTQQAPAPSAVVVTYTVATKGNISTDINEFTSQVSETLHDANGWSRLGVSFQQVESGGRFTVWLSEASQVTSFSSSGCDTTVSCTVGNNVIINQDRWVSGSDAWNGAGGSLRDYRHMVVNHEVGHWLGHGHRYCSGAGQPAPVMQQQTINMQGCTPNPWPQASEMYSPKLGIRS